MYSRPDNSEVRQRKNSGFSLVEVLTGSAIFLIVALAAYQSLSALMSAVNASRPKVVATTVANETFEIVRNLPYSDVGIVAGLPLGRLPRTQTVTRDGYSFDVEIAIRNVDDPFDGTIGGTPNDTSPSDYKLVDLDIACSNCANFPLLKFTTLVAPRALEEDSTSGSLFVQVFDSAGTPMPGASVEIENTSVDPDISIDETTDNEGWVRIYDAPPGVNTYNIVVSRSLHSTDQTYPLGGPAGAQPLKPDATVTLGNITELSFLIDRLSSIVVSTIDSSCVAVPSINFSLSGQKKIDVPGVIFKHTTQNLSTNVSGTRTVSNLEFDAYQVAVTSASYDLMGADPFINFDLLANESKDLDLVLAPHAANALLVSVVDGNGDPINGADVRIQRGALDDTETTSSAGSCPTPGQVFWNGLENGVHTLTVSASGYQTNISSPDITAPWQNINVILTP